MNGRAVKNNSESLVLGLPMNGQAIENNWVSELGLFPVLGLPMNGQAIENNWVSELGLFSVLGLPMNGQAVKNNSDFPCFSCSFRPCSSFFVSFDFLVISRWKPQARVTCDFWLSDQKRGLVLVLKCELFCLPRILLNLKR
jgi:hypothetical protein